MPKLRRATHAGTWYTENRNELSRQLDEWLSKASISQSPARAIIAPHAGYFYCGACSAYAYKQIDPTHIKRVFILGPSHKVRLSGCALSEVEKYCTPLYDLLIDDTVYNNLHNTGYFETMKLGVDESEHSLEMHLPYIAKVMERYKGEFTIVPILVGSLSPESEQLYGKLLSKYLADPENLFVISSDFCHWGRRFHYTVYDKTHNEISSSIKALDEMGMNIIEELEANKFTNYLKKYQNTICGRHPISVLINAVEDLQRSNRDYNMSMKFVKYAQSNQCKTTEDESVSYAAAALIIS